MTPRSTDAALRRLLDDGRARAAATDPEHARLWDALDTAAQGGKRFRPALVTLTHDALSGPRHDAAVQVGAAVELLHTAFVVHDDVIDGDHHRRGRPNVSGTFRRRAADAGGGPDAAEEYGRTAAILAGDLALAAAVRAVATCGAPGPVVGRLLDLFDEALHTTAAGELADVRLSLGLAPASLPDSLRMEEQKTSVYSFALPLQAGAVLADAPDDVLDRLGTAGRELGIAFQLVDDLVGVFADPARSGKSATTDLRTNKQTPLLVHARQTAEWTEVSRYVGRELDEESLVEVRRLLTVSGSRGFVEEAAVTRLSSARDGLQAIGVPCDIVDEVVAGATALLEGDGVAA